MVDTSVLDRSTWLPVVPPQGGATIPLFCFPYSGASAAIYQPWLSAPAPVVTLLPVELPGHGRRLAEPLHASLAPLVERVAEGLSPHLQAPFAFFGHSMGALLAFELARYLRDRNRIQPVHLFVSSSAAPQLPTVEEPLSGLPEAEFVQRLRQMNGMDEAILACDELRSLLLPILRADFSICETYRFQTGEALDCPITAFGGLSDDFVPRPALEAWGEHTRGAFRVSQFPGDHFYLHRARSLLLEVMARALSGHLARAGSERPL